MRTASVRQCHHVPVSRAHLVRAHGELLAHGPVHREHEATGGAVKRCLLCHRRRRTVLTLDPAIGSIIPADGRKHADASEPDLPRSGLQGRARRHGLQIVSTRQARDQACIVGRSGKDITGREIAGLDACTPWHPLGSHEGFRSGQQNDLADGDRLGPRSPGHRHGPLPADIGGIQARERVGGQSLALHHRRDVLTGHGLADLVHQRRAGDVDGTDENGVLLDISGGQDGSHAPIVSHPTPYILGGGGSQRGSRVVP